MNTETGFYLMLFTMILIAEIGVLIYEIYRITRKFNKLYNYFIRSEKDLIDTKKMSLKDIPPINGDCPTKEELDNFEP